MLPVAVILGVWATVAATVRDPLIRARQTAKEAGSTIDDLQSTVAAVNRYFEANWAAAGITPAPKADDLTVFRRLSLALHGTVPSLQEIRDFEADARPTRLADWTRRWTSDARYASYVSVRLSRAFVGAEDGPFVLFRRDRFNDWLRRQLAANVPFDKTVRSMIADTGLWTGEPQTNFITAAVTDGTLDENKITGRTVRAFLGQRIDCAQCHDHPFDDWKQSQFEGLAAFYGQTRTSIAGLEDKTIADGQPVEFRVQDRKTLEMREVSPSVPFHTEWLPSEGTRRERLAAWITNPGNRRFERAIANRVWGLMFGRPWIEPVDDIPSPGDAANPDLLDLLGRDFREHGYDLRRLIQVIAATRAFQVASHGDDEAVSEVSEDMERAWAAFPLVRLRPEQIIRSVLQCSTVQTVDQDSHWLFRLIRFFQEIDFVREYGDLGEEELTDRSGTIPQRLLLMNGELASEATKADPVRAAGRIPGLARDNTAALDATFLVCLTRRPTPEEQSAFLAELGDKQGDERRLVFEDLFWTLFNTTEFSWNH
jgi:hypothetical protein